MRATARNQNRLTQRGACVLRTFARLRQRLLDDGQVLEWEGPRRDTERNVWPTDLDGVVVDDVQAQFEGSLPVASAVGRLNRRWD